MQGQNISFTGGDFHLFSALKHWGGGANREGALIRDNRVHTLYGQIDTELQIGMTYDDFCVFNESLFSFPLHL